MRVKIKDKNCLERDITSNAIINTNRNDYEEAKKAKKKRLQMWQEIADIRGDISEIKNILEKIGKNI